MTPLQVCETILEGRYLGAKIRTFFVGLPDEEKHYWVSSLYALLMPPAKRQKLAAYFTPPHLADYVLDLMERAGIEIGSARFLDPASGGAAFLVPLARRIIKKAKMKRETPLEIIKRIESTLHGIEIEPDLAALSEILIKDLLKEELAKTKKPLMLSIARADTLKYAPSKIQFDAIVGNPPYGRVFRPQKNILENFKGILSDSYVNLYALFVEQSIRWVKPGGKICLIIPTSFIGGPYFAALRKRILKTCIVESLDLIDKRSDVFVDVVQDVCVLLLHKKGQIEFKKRPTCSVIKIDGTFEFLGEIDLPIGATERVWGLPNGRHDDSLFQEGLETLDDYGYLTKTGYFVWNREKDRYRLGKKPYKNEVPLYWAHNVRANRLCLPLERQMENSLLGFVEFGKNRTAVIKSDAILLQRTSNRRQNRRIVAGIIRQTKVVGGNGFVSENHTILILPNPNKEQLVSITALCRLLNTAEVDARFRRLSGSVSLSTKALRKLPLPSAMDVKKLFKSKESDEASSKLAYLNTISEARLQKMRPKHKSRQFKKVRNNVSRV